MTLPKTIIIGPLTYTIKEVTDLYYKGTPMLGLFSPSEQTISIECDMSAQRKHLTLWHEIVHAILNHAEKGDLAEDVVSILALGIMGILQANPTLHKEQ